MGPRLGGRGDAKPGKAWKEFFDASMGPRLGGRGDVPLHRDPHASTPASMGPRLGGRGDREPARPTRPGGEGFNGAAARWPRRHTMHIPAHAISTQLQWGRGSVAAETGVHPLLWGVVAMASMGPRLGGRGDVKLAWTALRDTRASMGPRLGGRGDLPSQRPPSRPSVTAGFNGAAARWPRRRPLCLVLPDQAAASMGPRLGGRGDRELFEMYAQYDVELQWGRGSVAAETGADEENSRGAWARFNGAAARWPRRQRGRGHLRHAGRRASMGPRLGGRGDRSWTCPGTTSACRGFNGAAARWPRRPTSAFDKLVLNRVLQWGRGSVAAETDPRGGQQDA